MSHSKSGPFSTGVAPALSAGVMNNLDRQYDDAMADTGVLYGHDVRPWAATTVYAAGQAVVSPSGDVVTAKTAHTSGSTFSGTGASGNWNLSTTFVPTALPGGWAGGVAGTRRAEFTFAGGGNSQFSGNLVDSHQRLMFKLPVTTTRWRLRIGNNNPDGTLTAGAISVTGVYLGTPVTDATGAPTGAFTAAPTSVISAFSTNADGSDLRTAWITSGAQQIAANTPAGLSIGWTATTGQVIQNGGARMWYSTGTGKNADAATAAPTLSTAQTTAFNIAIEYEFAAVNQVGLVIGDSLTDGYFTSATLLAMDTYHQHYSQRAGIPIIVTADYGSSSNEWTTLSQERWQRIISSGHTIDFAVVDIGSNDATNGATLSAFQGYVSSIVANLQSLGINRIYFNTVAPRALTGTNETNRVAFNTWLASRPFGIRAAFDVDALLADPATPANLRSGYAGSDTVHWSPYAHFRASLAWSPIG